MVYMVYYLIDFVSHNYRFGLGMVQIRLLHYYYYLIPSHVSRLSTDYFTTPEHPFHHSTDFRTL